MVYKINGFSLRKSFNKAPIHLGGNVFEMVMSKINALKKNIELGTYSYKFGYSNVNGHVVVVVKFKGKKPIEYIKFKIATIKNKIKKLDREKIIKHCKIFILDQKNVLINNYVVYTNFKNFKFINEEQLETTQYLYKLLGTKFNVYDYTNLHLSDILTYVYPLFSVYNKTDNIKYFETIITSTLEFITSIVRKVDNYIYVNSQLLARGQSTGLGNTNIARSLLVYKNEESELNFFTNSCSETKESEFVDKIFGAKLNLLKKGTLDVTMVSVFQDIVNTYGYKEYMFRLGYLRKENTSYIYLFKMVNGKPVHYIEFKVKKIIKKSISEQYKKKLFEVMKVFMLCKCDTNACDCKQDLLTDMTNVVVIDKEEYNKKKNILQIENENVDNIIVLPYTEIYLNNIITLTCNAGFMLNSIYDNILLYKIVNKYAKIVCKIHHKAKRKPALNGSCSNPLISCAFNTNDFTSLNKALDEHKDMENFVFENRKHKTYEKSAVMGISINISSLQFEATEKQDIKLKDHPIMLMHLIKMLLKSNVRYANILKQYKEDNVLKNRIAYASYTYSGKYVEGKMTVRISEFIEYLEQQLNLIKVMYDKSIENLIIIKIHVIKNIKSEIKGLELKDPIDEKVIFCAKDVIDYLKKQVYTKINDYDIFGDEDKYILDQKRLDKLYCWLRIYERLNKKVRILGNYDYENYDYDIIIGEINSDFGRVEQNIIEELEENHNNITVDNVILCSRAERASVSLVLSSKELDRPVRINVTNSGTLNISSSSSKDAEVAFGIITKKIHDFLNLNKIEDSDEESEDEDIIEE